MKKILFLLFFAVFTSIPASAKDIIPQGSILFATDLDGTMYAKNSEPSIEYKGQLNKLKEWLKKDNVLSIYVTARNLRLVEEVIKKYDLPIPDFVAAEVGTNLYERKKNKWHRVKEWRSELNKYWEKNTGEIIRGFMDKQEGAKPQEDDNQGEFKKCYYVYTHESAEKIRKKLRGYLDNLGIKVTMLVSGSGERLYVDFLPINGSKGDVVNFVAKRLNIPMEMVFYSGDSGNDEDALICGACAAFVGTDEINLAKELKKKHPKIYITKQPQIFGVIEGLKYCKFWF